MSIGVQAGSVAQRRPAEVMGLARLGASHPTRLSFTRVLVRRLAAERWQVSCALWRIDDVGAGVAVYRVARGAHAYSLVAFGHPPDVGARSDAPTADAWDATFALVDGEVDGNDLERLAAQVPQQSAARLSARELCLSRANRSGRLVAHIVEHLAAGRQPDPSEIERVGYVLRTTAVYGSGRFGCADRELWSDRPEFAAPFQVEMLTLYLIRLFGLDLVDHLARRRTQATAASLAPELRRRLGVGNATGPGLAPFLINHPLLLHNWVTARETALARVRAVERPTADERGVFARRLAEARTLVAAWRSTHPPQQRRLHALRRDLDRLAREIAGGRMAEPRPWDALYRWAERTCGLEGQELLVSLLLEPHGALVDDLAETMSADEDGARRVDGRMSVAEVRAILARIYDWALDHDDDCTAPARTWCAAPVTGEPHLVHGAPMADVCALPVAPGRDARALHEALAFWPDETALAEVLLRHPEHRRAARRAQLAADRPYAEIRDDALVAEADPLDLLRATLAFFGATRFDPVPGDTLRNTLFQGAPLPDDLAGRDADGWIDDACEASTGH